MPVIPGKGTTLQHGVSSTFTTVGQNVSLDGPGMEVGEADTVHLGSTLKTTRPTLPDPGELSGKLWFDPQDAVHGLFLGFIASPSTESWKLNFADDDQATWSFDGWLKEFKPTGIENESNLEADFTIRLTSIPVETTTP